MSKPMTISEGLWTPSFRYVFFFTPSLLLCYICVVHILNVVIFYLFVQVISYYSIQCLLYFLLTVLTSSSFNDNNNCNNNNSTIIYLQSNHYGLFICFWVMFVLFKKIYILPYL